VSGGTKAVSQTQKQQMVVMLGGLLLAFGFIVYKLPHNLTVGRALDVAGTLGHMKVIDFSLDLGKRYTFWSGIIGGLCLQLAYFGPDRPQVRRSLGGRSIREGRLGLLYNGLLKIPMQFVILMVGIMVFVFYQLERPPLYFHQGELERAYSSPQ